MEIKVGEYIRTKDGVIAKVTYADVMMVDCDRDVFDLNNLAMMEIPTEYIEEYIVKHAESIIDLIECGDYVNGKIVTNVDKVEEKNYIEWEDGEMYSTEIPNDKFIQDIVTHEQFNQRKYIVGG